LETRVAELERAPASHRQDGRSRRELAFVRQVERELAEAVLVPGETLARYGPPEPAPEPEPGASGRELSPAALRALRENFEGCEQAAGEYERTGVLVTASRRAYFGTSIVPGSERPIRRG
jgi:hypothetical protein